MGFARAGYNKTGAGNRRKKTSVTKWSSFKDCGMSGAIKPGGLVKMKNVKQTLKPTISVLGFI